MRLDRLGEEHFERNPFSSGTPAMAALATTASVAVIGMNR